MAWVKDGRPRGLPPFQPPPPPTVLPGGRANSLGSQASLTHAFSIDTQRSTEEEDELSRELTMELMQDMCLAAGEGRSQDGAAPPSSRRSSRRTSRRTSLALASDGETDTAAAEEEGEEGSDILEEEEAEEELQPSLYDQLGGGVVVKGLVDDFYGRVLGDPRLGPFFEGVDMTRHTRKFLLFVTYVLGGPDEYLSLKPQPWAALYTAHERLIRDSGLSEVHFDIVGGHFKAALEHAGASENVMRLALQVVESTRRIIFPLADPAQQASPQGQQQTSPQGQQQGEQAQQQAEQAQPPQPPQPQQQRPPQRAPLLSPVVFQPGDYEV